MSFGGSTTFKLSVMLRPEEMGVLPKLVEEFSALQPKKSIDLSGHIPVDIKPRIVNGRVQAILLTWHWVEQWHSRATPADMEELYGPPITVPALQLARRWGTDPTYCPRSPLGVATSYAASQEFDQLFGHREWGFRYDEENDKLIETWCDEEAK